jgi:predicted alpha/beta-fold hydrolase
MIRHRDAMTLLARCLPRPGVIDGLPREDRLFEVEPGSKILGHCHWRPDARRQPTLILVHGFEGCSDSHYMLGIAGKAWRAGFNVVRLNQRNCGGTEYLTPTLYHSGMSQDFLTVARELTAQDGIEAIWLVGYSMGGNLVLNAAGQAATSFSALKGVAAVCPNIDPAAAVATLEHPRNWIYHRHFLKSLQARMRRKSNYFPGMYDLSRLHQIRTLREFDDLYTAPAGGFSDAYDYYERTGARHVLDRIGVPTLIITSQDDPFIPYATFDLPALHQNPRIQFIAPPHGGHCGFIQRPRTDEDFYWAENRIIEFMTGCEAAQRTDGHTILTALHG